MTVINTNTGSLYAQQAMNTNNRGLATVMQQLSTGKRINNAVDDVAGLAISTRLTSQIRGLNQAVRNANDGISLVQTAEGATEQITNMLQRMRELAVQSSNDTNNDRDRSFLNGEFSQLRSEIDRIGQNTQWNGANILDGTGGIGQDGTFAFQVGANSRQTIEIKLPNMQTGVTDPVSGTTGSVSLDITTTSGTATFDFAAIATHIKASAGVEYSTENANEYLGFIVETEVLGKKYQYQITQNDLEAANTALSTDALLDKVTENLGRKIQAGVGSDFTVTYAPGSEKIDVALTDAGLDYAWDDAGNDANVVVTNAIKGLLNAIGGSGIDITTAAKAYEGLQAIDTALQVVNAQRSNMGAIISRLQFASDNLSNVAAKAAESRSRIEDTDYSVATTELAKRNIIQQAAQAMLAQANQAPQLVLQLLK